MPRILITNDDGYQSPSLAALAAALSKVGEVSIFAPDHNWSAAGHTKTMHKPLRVEESQLPDGTPLYITSGAPSDCVGLALLGLMERPDLVVSGLNLGCNMGQDITYSGTVAGAMEAAVSGIQAISCSRELVNGDGIELDYAAQVIAGLAQQLLDRPLPEQVFLNVNFPCLPVADVKGLMMTWLGRRVYRDLLVTRMDPKGRPYYWIGGEAPSGEPDDGTDVGALAGGYISVTPLNMDMTDRRVLESLSGWQISLPDSW